MKRQKRPVINLTSFGYISVDGKGFDHDIIITLEGEVKKRKKKLSKAIHGTSHIISLQEIEYVYQQGARGLLVGSGQYGVARLSDEASSFLLEKDCSVVVQPTPEAIKEWDRQEDNWIGLFHITC